MIKRFSIILMILGSGMILEAQTVCETDYAIYRNEFKQKNYQEALKSWRKVFKNCPEYNENTFADGPKLYQSRIKEDKQNKSLYLDTLMQVYDARIQYFGKEEYVLGKKGSDLFKYDPSQYSVSYQMLKKSIDGLGNSTIPTVLVSYFKVIVKCETAPVLDCDYITKKDILDAYVAVSDIISYNLVNNQRYAKNYEIALTNVENMFAPYASCDDLLPVFESRLAIDTQNLSLLKKITDLLTKKDCKDNQVFFTAARNLHTLEPTASSAYDMGNMSISKQDYAGAIDYFNESIEMAEDTALKASYYLRLAYASQMQGLYSQARKAANNAANLKPNWGEPYLMIGDIYVSSASSCGSSNLERGSVYWVAVDMFNKAKSIDDLLSEKANKKISTYSRYFPSKEDCFFNDIESGSSYKVECWIGRSTKVRTRD